MKNSAVIINEFGEVGIDHFLVEQSDDNIILLENGCLCCEMKGDLIDTLQDLHAKKLAKAVPWFDRVLIETTGIADPGQVMQVILNDPLISTKYALGDVVTTLDAENGLKTLDRFPESVRQIAVADKIIVTKIDTISEKNCRTRLEALRCRATSINPDAPVNSTKLDDLDPSIFFENDEASQNRASIDSMHGENGQHHDHTSNIYTFCIVRDKPINLETLKMFLEAIASDAGEDLLRVKGIVNIAERPEHPAIIQGAQKVFHSLKWMKNWPDHDHRTRIVFITHGIERSQMENSFDLIERFSGNARQVTL